MCQKSKLGSEKLAGGDYDDIIIDNDDYDDNNGNNDGDDDDNDYDNDNDNDDGNSPIKCIVRGLSTIQ